MAEYYIFKFSSQNLLIIFISMRKSLLAILYEYVFCGFFKYEYNRCKKYLIIDSQHHKSQITYVFGTAV